MSGTGRARRRCPRRAIYDHGPQHPLRPQRVLLTWDLIAEYGLDRAPGVTRLGAEPRPTTRRCGSCTPRSSSTPPATQATGSTAPGAGSATAPATTRSSTGMHEAGALVAGASVAAARAVLAGRRRARVQRAPAACTTRCPRAPRGSASTTTPRSRSRGCSPRASSGSPTSTSTCTTATDRRRSSGTIRGCSRSRSTSTRPRSVLPRNRRTRPNAAGPDAPGSAVNLPLPPARATRGGSRRSARPCPPLVRDFGPDVLVTQLGCDTHATDPLAHLGLTTRAYREAASMLHELAHDAAGGRWVATGGGGYQWARVVPRAWTIYFAEMAGADARPDELPEAWIERAEFALGGEVPTTLSELPARRRRSTRRPQRWRQPRSWPQASSARRRIACRRRQGSVTATSLPTRTKLVCTLGPATNTPAFVRGLVAGRGVDLPGELLPRHARRPRACRAARARRRGRGRSGARGARRPARARRCGSARCIPIRSGSRRGSRSSCGQTGPATSAARRRRTRAWPRTCARATACCWPTARSSCWSRRSTAARCRPSACAAAPSDRGRA